MTLCPSAPPSSRKEVVWAIPVLSGAAGLEIYAFFAQIVSDKIWAIPDVLSCLLQVLYRYYRSTLPPLVQHVALVVHGRRAALRPSWVTLIRIASDFLAILRIFLRPKLRTCVRAAGILTALMAIAGKVLAPDLVFRVDSVRAEYNIPAATLTQPHPALLFRSIEGKSAILGDLKLASIWWTVKGNLTFAFVHDEQFSIEEAKKRAWTIWDHVCPLLNFPKNCDPNMAITLDTGEPWHNIVIHSVPLPGAVVDGPPLPNIFSWLRRCGVAGEIKTVSFMCSDDDLGKRDKAPLRVSLSSQGDADMLVHSGALILGSQCHTPLRFTFFHYLELPVIQLCRSMPNMPYAEMGRAEGTATQTYPSPTREEGYLYGKGGRLYCPALALPHPPRPNAWVASEE
ncbi:hypothetical protein K438DRAFT_1785828 [Mycena galopus ATCC 62051]|nr:hypothetical protein K438DRAFT_1785828 [Mycena galopus ATCC 62051]